MSDYKYSEQEIERNKVLKYNQDTSKKALELAEKANRTADASIEASIALLEGLGISVPNFSAAPSNRIEQKPVLEDWDDIVSEASQYVPNDVTLEDLLTKEEIDKCWGELDEINAEFEKLMEYKALMLVSGDDKDELFALIKERGVAFSTLWSELNEAVLKDSQKK